MLDNVIIVRLEGTHSTVSIEILVNFFLYLVNIYPCIFFIVSRSSRLIIIIFRLCCYHHSRWMFNFLAIFKCFQIFNGRIITLINETFYILPLMLRRADPHL